jgi:hypothetical protein
MERPPSTQNVKSGLEHFTAIEKLMLLQFNKSDCMGKLLSNLAVRAYVNYLKKKS